MQTPQPTTLPNILQLIALIALTIVQLMGGGDVVQELSDCSVNTNGPGGGGGGGGGGGTIVQELSDCSVNTNYGSLVL